VRISERPEDSPIDHVADRDRRGISLYVVLNARRRRILASRRRVSAATATVEVAYLTCSVFSRVRTDRSAACRLSIILYSRVAVVALRCVAFVNT